MRFFVKHAHSLWLNLKNKSEVSEMAGSKNCVQLGSGRKMKNHERKERCGRSDMESRA
jgi:hypothetical protein